MNEFFKSYIWPVVITISAVLSAILAFTNAGGALRPIIIFWFIFICPGMAIIRLIRLGDPAFELILSIALSLVLGALISEFLVLTRHWSPPTVLVILIVISLIGAALQLRNLMIGQLQRTDIEQKNSPKRKGYTQG